MQRKLFKNIVFNNLKEIAEYMVTAGKWKILPDTLKQPEK